VYIRYCMLNLVRVIVNLQLFFEKRRQCILSFWLCVVGVILYTR